MANARGVSTSTVDQRLATQIKHQLGDALCVAVLWAGAASAAGPHAAGELRVWLPAEAMHAARMRSGQQVAVCIAADACGPAATPPTPTSPFSPAGGAGVAASLPPASSLTPAPLWGVLSSGCGVKLQPPDEPALGAYAAAATVWPAPRLPRTSAVASHALWEHLGCPGAGRLLILYQLPAGPAAGPSSSTAAGVLALRMVASSSGGSGGGGGGSSGAVPGVGQLWKQQQSPVALVALPPVGYAAGGSATGGAGGSPSPFKPAGVLQRTPGKRPDAVASTPVPAQAPFATSAASGGGGGGGGGSGGGVSSAATAWASQALASGDPSQAELLRLLLARHLAGRTLLEGNPVLLPVLGQHLVMQVAGDRAGGCKGGVGSSGNGNAASGGAAADGGISGGIRGSAAGAAGAGGWGGAAAAAAQQQQQGEQEEQQQEPGLPPWAAAAAVLLVGRQTVIQLLPLQGDQERGEQQLATGGAALRGGAAGTAVGGSGAVAAAAARAAADAVGGGADGAAAQAASAAALAGARVAAGGWAEVGGMRAHVSALQQLVGLPLRSPHLFSAYGLAPPRGVLLHGPPGTGKTLLCRAAARESGAALLLLSGPDVLSEFLGESEAGLRGVFAAARALAPSILFIDELDALAPARGGSGGGGGGAAGMSSRVVTTLLTEMDGLGEAGGVVVLGTTNRLDAIEPALRRPGRFDRELHVAVPSPQDREEILRLRLRGVSHCLSDKEIGSLAAAAHGFVGADLQALVAEASMAALRRVVRGSADSIATATTAITATAAAAASTATTTATAAAATASTAAASAAAAATGGAVAGVGPHASAGQERQQLRVTMDDFRAAETLVRPSGLREVAVEVPRCGWSDVGGLEGVKERLREAVQWPQSNAAALARVGAVPPRGVLLYGPPGCSKTLLARCVAGEAGLNFLAVKGPELFSKYVGESEKAVAALFARARSSAPSIVFFDELDGLAGSRGGGGPGGGGEADGGGGSSVSDRVLSQMLTEMDGLQTGAGGAAGGAGGVVVLAATNRPDCVDPALLRPGRFDRLLFVPPPDGPARRAVLEVHTRATPLAGDVDLPALAMQTDGFTGADLMSLVREAALAALQEDLGAEHVAARHFSAALGSVHRSLQTPREMMALYERFQRSAA